MKGYLSIRASLALMLLGALFSCGKPDSGATSGEGAGSDEPTAVIATTSLEEAKAQIRRASVSCEDRANCSASVALLAIAMKDGVSRCTAFLVSSDILLTNSHCIPAELRVDAGPLDSRVFAYFPETATNAAISVEVDHIISASKIDENPKSPVYSTLPDYAFLRLKKAIFREKMILSYGGLEPDTFVNVYKMNPSKYTLSATLVTQACQTARSNSLLRNYISAAVPLVSLVNCEIIQGNSGSPVVTNDGRVAAVIFAGSGKGGVYYSSRNGESIRFSNMARATNLACVAPPWSPKRSLPGDCRTTMLEPYFSAQGSQNLEK